MDLLNALIAGLALAASFNPVVAAIFSATASALLADQDAVPRRWSVGLAVLLTGWLVGDGLRVLGRARDFVDGAGALFPVYWPASAQWTALGLWALGSLVVGYALPAWAGVFAGRRVTHGIDWAVAATVAVGVSLALTAVSRSVLAALGPAFG